jgi:hypothetical protein
MAALELYARTTYRGDARATAALDAPAGPGELLRAYIVPATPVQALLFLSRTVQPVKLLALYQHYFPEEMAASSARMAPDEAEAYSPAEIEFFRLVNNRLFPLDEYLLWCMTEDEFADERTEGRVMRVPVTPVGLEWWDQDPKDFRVGWQFLITLFHTIVVEGLGYDLSDTQLDSSLYQEIDEMNGEGLELTEERLTSACEGLKEPLCWLPLAIEMISHETGCAWLDADDQYHELVASWNRKEIDWLASEWKECKEIDAKVYALLDWLDGGNEDAAGAGDVGHMREVLALWRECTTVRSRRPRTLVEVFTGNVPQPEAPGLDLDELDLALEGEEY